MNKYQQIWTNVNNYVVNDLATTWPRQIGPLPSCRSRTMWKLCGKHHMAAQIRQPSKAKNRNQSNINQNQWISIWYNIVHKGMRTEMQLLQWAFCGANQQISTHIMNKYQQIWTNINKYDQIWRNVININKYEQISTNISNYQQIWTNINKS